MIWFQRGRNLPNPTTEKHRLNLGLWRPPSSQELLLRQELTLALAWEEPLIELGQVIALVVLERGLVGQQVQ